MRRDPTEFRQRFAAWKDGENYWDVRGEDMLPGYSGGKTGFYNTHRDKWRQFLISKGVGAEQADRLSVYFAAQDSLESGGGTSSAARQKNNFGGMQRGGKNISYDTVQDYMNDKWNMMNKRFSRALNAKTVQEYATLINDPKYAGKGYLYAVADGYNQKNPQDRAWVARQIQHMNNYTKAMMGIAGQKGFVARPVPKAPVISKAEPIQKANPIPSAVELLKQNELPVVLPEPAVTTTQTPTQAAQQAQLSEYIQKPPVSEKVPVLGNDYWENFFNNNSLDQFQSLMQQQMTSHKHGKNILPRHKDGKTPGEYNEELVELPEVRVDDEGNVVNNGRKGSVRLPEVVVNRTDPRNYRSAFNGNQEYLDDIVGFVPVAGDVNDAINASIAANKGDYLQAGILGGGLLLPNVLEKPLRSGIKFFKNAWLDYKYLNAIKHKHIQTLKQLRDKHFIDSAPTSVYKKDNRPITLYHGTPTKGWNEYKDKFFGSNTDSGYYGKGLYLSENPNHASIYKEENGELKELYLNANRPFYSGQLDVPFNEAVFRGNLAAWFNQPNMKNLAIDEANITNFLDEQSKRRILTDFFNSDISSHIEKGVQEHIAVPLSNMMKYKNPITRDDNGKLIKLSKRDDFSNPDFRYKHGKNPIRINPANRGKFNALKKRTGKTTEQLTHSKNPLTRKRAIFALNSRKWRRK